MTKSKNLRDHHVPAGRTSSYKPERRSSQPLLARVRASAKPATTTGPHAQKGRR